MTCHGITYIIFIDINSIQCSSAQSTWGICTRRAGKLYTARSRCARAVRIPDVSKPNFANKYSLERSWRDLSDLQFYIPLHLSELNNLANVRREICCLTMFTMFQAKSPKPQRKKDNFRADSCETWPNFVGILQVVQKILLNTENLRHIFAFFNFAC